jgi:hypothetical protein
VNSNLIPRPLVKIGEYAKLQERKAAKQLVGHYLFVTLFVARLLQAGTTFLLQSAVSYRFCYTRPVAQLVRALP